ncbi:MAG TPA: ABC transporter substrate-binding protein [Acidimicrobiia bacterium]|nr:ABC transporter substrate-binding protein [Acidimicrobiia bacterium]
MMKLRLRWLALVAVLLLVVAACGGDDDDAGTDEATAATEAPTETTEATTDDGGEEATTTTEAMTDETEAPAGEILTDVGVDLEAGTITVGLLSDLSGPFAGLVSAIVAGQEAYWAYVNANGGIEGLEVVLEVRDTNYEVPAHVELYAELKDQVVAFGHSTGSPHTVAIYEDLVADGVLAIPLTWYSGWTAPFQDNTMHHGSPYCIEAMNTIDYVVNETGAQTIAIASLPGDYGLDSAAGAALAAEALGLEVVYDGSGQIIPGEDAKPIADAIVAANPDMVFVTATSGTFAPLYAAAIAQGFEKPWAGASPTYTPAYLASDFAAQFERDWWGSTYSLPWGADTPGNQLVRDVMEAAGAAPLDYYAEGFIEAQILEAALRAAYASGDMTQAGVLAAAKSLESVDFGGLAPAERYTGTPDEQINRQTVIYRTSIEDLLGGGTGTIVLDPAYTAQIAADFNFESACFEL